jgi:DNA-directed RNA polymerase specialized sigma24 family protein
VKDRTAAEDLCQEAFVSMLGHIGQCEHYGKFQNYHIIARNKCRNFYKKKKLYLYDEIPEGEQETVENEDGFLIKELVHKLPKEFEEAIILRFYQDLKCCYVLLIIVGTGECVFFLRVR